MADWHPMNLCDCVDSPTLGWLTGVLSVGMIVWYALIARRWLEAARYASRDCQAIWSWLVVIFVASAIAGYGSWALALIEPRIAVPLRIAMLVVQNIACPMFWFNARGRRFLTMGRYEKIGDEIVRALNTTHEMNDRDLASLTRMLVNQSLQRMEATGA